jgi:para-nitrobenzyl esterase
VKSSFALLTAITAGLASPGCSSKSSSAPPGPDTTVTFADGQVQADIVGGTRRFLAIPYAEPPVGDLRWKAPVKNAPWTGVLHATEFASACPQSQTAQDPMSVDEDCLYLNVWTPEPAPKDAPVMVWFHGGGNFSGSAHDLVPTTQQLWYDGQFFASRHGVVVVTVNYRLGPMGFFPHPALAAEGSPTGNQGLFDQRAALQWVQANITAFGGDPGNVTIFGESAGSADVCYHVVSGVTGLFERAVSESGGCSISVSGGPEETAAQAAPAMQSFTQTMGCDTAADALSCLRGKSASDILAAAPTPDPTLGSSLTTPYPFGVVVDGPGGFLPDQPRTLLGEGRIVRVPYLLGSNDDEGMLFILTATIPTNDSEYLTALQSYFGDGDFASQVLAEYPVASFGGDYRDALGRAIGDSALVCGTHDTARRIVEAGAPAFMYNFNIPWAIEPTLLLASHASEISHVFGDPIKPSASSQAVSDTMNAFWAHFASTGDPNFPDAAATWPAFQPDVDGGDERLQLDPGWEVIQNFRAQECAFWRAHYDALYAADGGVVTEGDAGVIEDGGGD